MSLVFFVKFCNTFLELENQKLLCTEHLVVQISSSSAASLVNFTVKEHLRNVLLRNILRGNVLRRCRAAGTGCVPELLDERFSCRRIHVYL